MSENVEMRGYALRWSADEVIAPGAITQETLDATIARGLPVTRDFRADDVIGQVTSGRVDEVGVELVATLTGISEELGQLLSASEQPFACAGPRKVEQFRVLGVSLAPQAAPRAIPADHCQRCAAPLGDDEVFMADRDRVCPVCAGRARERGEQVEPYSPRSDSQRS